MGDRGRTDGDALAADPVQAPENGLLGTRGRRALLALIFVLVGMSVTVLRIVPALATRFGGQGGEADIWFAILNSVGIVAVALAGALIFRRWIWLGHKEGRLARSALPIGIAGVLAAMAIAYAAGGVVHIPHPEGAGSIGLLLAGTLLIIALAVGEEILMRGLLQPLLIRAWGPAVGIVVTSLAFALIHYIGGWDDPVSLINIFVASIWFGLLAWRTGGFLAPSLAHVGWNWAEAMLVGADVNPGRSPYGSLVDLDLVGPASLGGSPYGLNGSLLLTLVLAAIILPLVLRTRGARLRSQGTPTT